MAYKSSIYSQDGLQVFNHEQKKLETIITSKDAIPLETIWAIYENQDSILWLGGMQGLQAYNPKKKQLELFDKYNNFQELAQSHIVFINNDNNGLIWICSNSGLYTLDVNEGITAHFGSNETGANYLPHDNFHHFHQDKEGIFWLASAGGGLIRWDKENNSFQQFTKVDGLSNNVIYAIYEDQHQHLWMSSDYGIIQFDKKTFQSKAYLMEDGISHSEFNRVSHFQSPDGRIYFGSLNGVTAFHPDDFYDFEKFTLNATVQITDFQQFDDASNRLKDKTSELIETNKIILNPDDPFFRLGFSLLTYEPSNKIQYAYQIEGVDKDWTYQKEASIQMGRLPYGDHVLKIKGQAANGQWSSEELAINIHALRPFYLQLWFLILSGLSLITLILGSIKWRTLQYQKNQEILELEVANQTSMIQQQTDELKELDASKNRFYNNISHEFRTPITVIMGMMDNIKGHENERSLVRRNSKNLLRLVNQLLDLSKIESGSMEINLVKGDIINYLQYLTESFDSAAKEKSIQLFFYGEQRTLYMAFDEVKFQQIIYNLLSNAIKFTAKYGKVVLHATQIEKDNNAYVQLKITDNGVGIAAEELPHIFDRFYQTDSSTTRKGEGTGIGLALTKELIELMKGFIYVKSTLGQGTEFTLLFPIKEATKTLPNAAYRSAVKIVPEEVHRPTSIETTKIEQSHSFQENGLPQILIIEDNLDVIFYLESILKKEYQIIKAEDGSKGINKAYKFIPDLIITDVMMPEKDGFEVCQTLKNDQRTSHIPIIILTAKATDADRMMGLENGADAFLMKPFNKKELFIRLEKLIDLRKALQKRYGHSNYYLRAIEKESKSLESRLSIEQLSQSVQLSQSQLYRKLKALTGETPIQFIRKIRLHRSLEMLKTTDLNIAEIAYSVGFNDPNYFSRMFHKEFGKSPRLFRK